MKLPLSVCTVAVWVAVSAQSTFGATVTIDTFDTAAGVTDVIAVGAAPSSAAQLLSTGAAIGGTRLTRSHMVTGGAGDRNRVRNDSSFPLSDSLVLSQDTGVTGHFHLYYGYTDYDPSAAGPTSGTHTFSDLNANFDAATNNRIRFDIITADQAGSIRITLVSNRDLGLGTSEVAQVIKSWGGAVSNYELSWGLSEFAGIDFTDIDQIVIESLDFTSADMAIDNIQVVPEPGSLAMFGAAGMVGLVYGWRRRVKRAA